MNNFPMNNLRNMTDGELINALSTSNTPIIKLLIDRLEQSNGELEMVEKHTQQDKTLPIKLKGEVKMLEQRLKNLESQVAKLTIAIENLIIAMTTTPAPETAVKKAPKQKPKVKAVGKEVIETDVQKALVELVNRVDRNAALEVLAMFNATKLSDLDKSQYAKVVTAAKANQIVPEAA